MTLQKWQTNTNYVTTKEHCFFQTLFNHPDIYITQPVPYSTLELLRQMPGWGSTQVNGGTLSMGTVKLVQPFPCSTLPLLSFPHLPAHHLSLPPIAEVRPSTHRHIDRTTNTSMQNSQISNPSGHDGDVSNTARHFSRLPCVSPLHGSVFCLNRGSLWVQIFQSLAQGVLLNHWRCFFSWIC